MKRPPIKFACYFEYSGVRPEKERRFALYGVSIRSTSVNDLIRYDGIHCFTVDWTRINEGWKANRDCENDNPERSETKSPQAISWQTHRCAILFPPSSA
jgi:hypothetical protein